MKSSWKRKQILITAGPTREYFDPIRFLSNASSGRMGYALAREAARLGARVTVVSGPCPEPAPSGVKVVSVVSALEMRRKTLSLCTSADAVIGAAAVSDWRSLGRARHKIKRSAGPLRLTLVPNPDIIKEVSRRRRPGSRQVVVGFALETRRGLLSARAKLEGKGLDLVVANGLAALSSERSRAVIVGRRRRVWRLPLLSKRELARRILKAIEEQWGAQNSLC